MHSSSAARLAHHQLGRDCAPVIRVEAFLSHASDQLRPQVPMCWVEAICGTRSQSPRARTALASMFRQHA